VIPTLINSQPHPDLLISKQNLACLLACLSWREASKQARGLILGNQASKGRACLLACLFIACI